MKIGKITITLAVLIAAGTLLASSIFFTVGEREFGLKLFFGEIQRWDYRPGLHIKWPFANKVYKFDRRVLSLDMPPERMLTIEKKNLIVDSFVKWRIEDHALFFRATAGNERRALSRLLQLVRKGLLDAFGKRTVQEAVSGKRAILAQEVQDKLKDPAIELGVTVVDVRIKKVELPEDVENSVFRRMEKERATAAKTFRARGEEQAKGIRADAERQREEVLAGAYGEAERIRGLGDAKAANIYAQVHNRDPEFYNFYRSLSAYQKSFQGNKDLLILQPNSHFFRYFQENRPTGLNQRR